MTTSENGANVGTEAISAPELRYLRKIEQGRQRAQQLLAEVDQIQREAAQEIANRQDEATRLIGAYESYSRHFYTEHTMDGATDTVDLETGVIKRGALQRQPATP